MGEMSEKEESNNKLDVESKQIDADQNIGRQSNCEINTENKDIDFDKLMKSKRAPLFFKRIFDIISSFLGLIIVMVPLIFVAVIIKVTSKGPILFKQVRVGKDGKLFKIFKFRTMIVDAEKKGAQITIGNDNRITKAGKILRKTKIDELPQLINVLIGNMSLVGPRPEVPHYVEMYNDYQKNILRIRPGITELASIVYRNENELLEQSSDPEITYVKEIMPKKIDLNMQYMMQMNVLYDIKLIIKTIFAIVKK